MPMPMPSPYQIVLSGEEQAVLTARARSVRGPYRDRLRAAIVLAAAAGEDNAEGVPTASAFARAGVAELTSAALAAA